MSADILSAIYDATILLSTGLTTVLGAIFAIATTFLGRSLQDAREAQDQEEQNARADADSAVAEFKKTLAETSHTADSQGTIANLRNQLRAREKAEKARRRKQGLRRFFQGPHLLGVWGSVATPGVFLVVGRIRNSCCKSFNRRPFLYLVGNVGWQFNISALWCLYIAANLSFSGSR